MADQDIAQQWKSFSPERRDALLDKMTPEQKNKLRAALETPTATTHAASADNTPGFFKRLAQGVGIPTSKQELTGLLPTKGEIIASGANPMFLPGTMLLNRYRKGLAAEGGKTLKETGEAIQNVRGGGPIGANVGKVGAAGTEFLLRGVLGPIGGGSVQAWGEDVHSGNYTGAAGDALAVLTNALLLKGALKPTAEVRANKIAYAGDVPETMDAGKQIKAVLPDLDASAAQAPRTVGELLDNVKAAKEKINNEVGQAMFQLRGKNANPMPIADAIKSHITPDMQMTPQGRATANALTKAAADFQKPWTFEQLQAARVNANARLRTFFKKGTSAQYGDMKTEVGTIVDREVARGVQDIVYPEMDKAAGKPTGYFRSLLNRQGTLIQLGDALDENAKALATRTAKIKGSPRFSSENVSAYGHPATTPGISIHKLQNVFVRPNPAARANAAVARASGSFRGSPVSHTMVYSFPVRQLLLQDEEPPKTPADAKQRMSQFAPAAP
jgi:hypothetical protein